MNTFLESLKERSRLRQKIIIFPESQDDRVVEACQKATQENLFRCLLVGNDPKNGLEYRKPQEDPNLPLYAEQYRGMVKRVLSLEEAQEEILEPNLYAAFLVRNRIVHGGVSGSMSPTSSIIRAGIRGVGSQKGLVSSCFLMSRGDLILGYGDCGVVPAPNQEQLVNIALSTASTYQTLTGQAPRVALLSFSTLGSADHSRLDPVRGALKQLREQVPDLLIDGELQFDAAFVPEIAARKCPKSPLKGQANVFIFPDLNAGNIAYKITERLGGFTALGPLLQGLNAPWMDLSRGCSSNDILQVGLIASILDRQPQS